MPTPFRQRLCPPRVFGTPTANHHSRCTNGAVDCVRRPDRQQPFKTGVWDCFRGGLSIAGEDRLSPFQVSLCYLLLLRVLFSMGARVFLLEIMERELSTICTVTIANVSDQSNRARRDCRRSHRWVALRGSPWCHGLANLDNDKIFISQTSCSLP